MPQLNPQRPLVNGYDIIFIVLFCVCTIWTIADDSLGPGAFFLFIFFISPVALLRFYMTDKTNFDSFLSGIIQFMPQSTKWRTELKDRLVREENASKEMWQSFAGRFDENVYLDERLNGQIFFRPDGKLKEEEVPLGNPEKFHFWDSFKKKYASNRFGVGVCYVLDLFQLDDFMDDLIATVVLDQQLDLKRLNISWPRLVFSAPLLLIPTDALCFPAAVVNMGINQSGWDIALSCLVITVNVTKRIISPYKKSYFVNLDLLASLVALFVTICVDFYWNDEKNAWRILLFMATFWSYLRSIHKNWWMWKIDKLSGSIRDTRYARKNLGHIIHFAHFAGYSLCFLYIFYCLDDDFIMLLTSCSLLVFVVFIHYLDVVCYVKRSRLLKTLVILIEMFLVHLGVGIIIIRNISYDYVSLHMLIFLYWTRCPFWFLSLYHIEKGFPYRVTGPVYIEKHIETDSLYKFLMKIYNSTPDAPNIRALIDRLCKNKLKLTTKQFFEIKKMYKSTFSVHCSRMKIEHNHKFSLTRFLVGFYIHVIYPFSVVVFHFLIVIFIAYLSRFYIRTYTRTYSTSIVEATFQLQIEHYPPIYETTNFNFYPENPTDIDKNFESNFDIYATDFPLPPMSFWTINPPALQHLMGSLNDSLDQSSLNLYVRCEVQRVVIDDAVDLTHNNTRAFGQTSIRLTNQMRTDLLRNLNGSRTEVNVKDSIPAAFRVKNSGKIDLRDEKLIVKFGIYDISLSLEISNNSMWWNLKQNDPDNGKDGHNLHVVFISEKAEVEVSFLDITKHINIKIISIICGVLMFLRKIGRRKMGTSEPKLPWKEAPDVSLIQLLIHKFHWAREMELNELPMFLYAKLLFLYRSNAAMIANTAAGYRTNETHEVQTQSVESLHNYRPIEVTSSISPFSEEGPNQMPETEETNRRVNQNNTMETHV